MCALRNLFKPCFKDPFQHFSFPRIFSGEQLLSSFLSFCLSLPLFLFFLVLFLKRPFEKPSQKLQGAFQAKVLKNCVHWLISNDCFWDFYCPSVEINNCRFMTYLVMFKSSRREFLFLVQFIVDLLIKDKRENF